MTPRVEHLFGLDFVADSSVREISDAVLRSAAERTPGWHCLVTPNVDHLVRYERNEHERAVARTATLVVPDGMPIVWASRLLKRPLRCRITGADVFADLWPRLAVASIPAVVVASSDAVAAGLAATTTEALTIVAPRFEVDDAETVDHLVARIEDAVDQIAAGVVVIGVSMPKHHLLASRLYRRWAGDDTPHPYVLLLGASPEFMLGLRARAPRLLQRLGLEWTHRLVTDPRHMAKRYLIDDVRFIGMVWRAWRARTPR